MSLWPWRSRPVVTPFMDDYSGRVLTFPGTFNASPFSISIPDNIYIMPSSIAIPFDTAAGIRGTIPSCCCFFRGSTRYAGIIFGTLSNNQTGTFFLADYGDEFSPAGITTVRAFQLPKPILVYPSDRIEFEFDSLFSGDVVGPITIHGKFWEVH